MTNTADTIRGINIEVEELIRVRGQLSGINLKSIKRRSSYRSGAQDARLRGRGMEYEESRAYVFGDDIRTIDWRVMARTGEAHTKVFAEEKERRYLLAIDLSASMFFGTRHSYKSWTAAYICAYLGWLAHQAGDRLGGVIAAPDRHYRVKPGKTRSGLLGLFHHLADVTKIRQPVLEAGRLNFLLAEMQRFVNPGSIITVISDFIGIDQNSAQLLSQLSRQNDVNFFWVHDEIELNSWPEGSYAIRTGEREFNLDLTEDLPSQWLNQQILEHRKQLELLTAQLGIPLFPVCCNRALAAQMALNLGER